MKTLKALLILALVIACALAQAGPAQAGVPWVVTLTAEDVRTAQDIEAAMHVATQWGSRPGTVILDGSQGPFVYTIAEANDYTINIFYPNLSLVGSNGAVFPYSQGIFFDDLPADHILIKNLTMHCETDCIVSWGNHWDVQIQNVRLYGSGIGIQVAQTDGWSILRSTIQGGWTAVHVLEASNISIVGNQLSGFIPVLLQNSHNSQVKLNTLAGSWQGVLLTAPSSYNRVIANSISGVEQSGVSLEEGTFGNRVIDNVVSCAPGVECLTVSADGSAAELNKIFGNLP